MSGQALVAFSTSRVGKFVKGAQVDLEQLNVVQEVCAIFTAASIDSDAHKETLHQG